MVKPDLFEIIIHPINQLGLRYMITGGAAAIVYGIPRMTHDLDLVLEIEDNQLDAFLQVFPDVSFDKPSKECVLIELSRPVRGHFCIIHHETGFKADIFLMGENPLHHWAMDLRHKIPYNNETLRIAPAEYVIVQKLAYIRDGGSEQHARDIGNIIKFSQKLIDKALLKEKIESCGLMHVWKDVVSGQ